MREQLTEVLLCSFGQLGGLLYLLWDSHKLGLYNKYSDLVESSHFPLFCPFILIYKIQLLLVGGVNF